MDPVAALLTGAALLGCMMLSYIRGWKDAVAQYAEVEDTGDSSRQN